MIIVPLNVVEQGMRAALWAESDPNLSLVKESLAQEWEDLAMKNHKKLKKAHKVLSSLAENVDEDCPAAYRTNHLRQALYDALRLLENADGV